MRTLVSVYVFHLFLIGCVEVQDSKNASDDNIIQVSGLSYQIESLVQPQAYLVRFAGVDCNQSAMKMTRSKSDQVIQLNQCSEVVNEPGLHVYKFTEGTLQVEIPLDVVIKGHVQLSQLNPKEVELKARYSQHLKVAGRLFFESGSVLSTKGESVLIEADSVSSEGGRIVTHFDPVNAPYAQHGKHGGLIHLKSDKIQGALEVILQGQNGGDGEPSHFRISKSVESIIINGGNGGNSGKFWLETLDHSMSQIKVTKIPGTKGIGSEIRGGCGFGSGDTCQPRVLRPKGTDGQAGLEERSCLIVNNECTNFNLN